MIHALLNSLRLREAIYHILKSMRETLFHIYHLWNVRNIRRTQNVWDHGCNLNVLIDGHNASCWNDGNIVIDFLSDQHLKYWLSICCFLCTKVGMNAFSIEYRNHHRKDFNDNSWISIKGLFQSIIKWKVLLESCHCAYLLDAVLNTRRPRQHGRNFQTMLRKGPVPSKASLRPVMTWRRTDHKP